MSMNALDAACGPTHRGQKGARDTIGGNGMLTLGAVGHGGER